MQPAEEGPCVPKIGRQRSPFIVLSKRTEGGDRYDRPTMVEIPHLGGEGGGGQYPQHLTYHNQNLYLRHYQPSPINNTAQRCARQRFPNKNKPGYGVSTSTSTSATTAGAASPDNSRTVGGAAGHHTSKYSAGHAARCHKSPDCNQGLSTENRLILDAFAQQCSRVLGLLNSNGGFPDPRPPPTPPVLSGIKQEDGCFAGMDDRKTSGAGLKTEDVYTNRNQQQTSAVLQAFTESLQSHLMAGGQLAHTLGNYFLPSGAELRPTAPARSLGGYTSPTPSESQGHPSSTLPEEEEEEESCCPHCLELEQEVFCLQQENEELRRKLDRMPEPCQATLDFFKRILQHHNQFEQQLTEGNKQLLGNYPVFITNKQWDEALNSSKKDGRRLLRCLIRFIFTSDELKYSCGLGKRKRSVQTGEAGPERWPLNPVKVTCLREFIRTHCISNPEWWMPSEEQINKVFSDAVGHARQGRAVGTFLGSAGSWNGRGSASSASLTLEGSDSQVSQDEIFLKASPDED